MVRMLAMIHKMSSSQWHEQGDLMLRHTIIIPQRHPLRRTIVIIGLCHHCHCRLDPHATDKHSCRRQCLRCWLSWPRHPFWHWG
jgi:hypothetical protein